MYQAYWECCEAKQIEFKLKVKGDISSSVCPFCLVSVKCNISIGLPALFGGMTQRYLVILFESLILSEA